MITQSESNLSSDDYAYLNTVRTAPSYQVIAHRWNLNFEALISSLPSYGASNFDDDYDTVQLGTNIFRVRGGVFEKFDLTNETLTTIAFTPPSGLAENSRYKLTTNNIAAVHLLCNTTDGLVGNAYFPGSGTFSGWFTLVSTSASSVYSVDHCFGGTASASQIFASDKDDYTADRAFDNIGATAWRTQNSAASPQWIKYDLGDGKEQTITKWRINFQDASGSSTTDLTLQGSNDNSAWDDLDTRSNQSSITSDLGYHEYTVTSPNNYRYYRVSLAGWSGSYVLVREISLYSSHDVSYIENFCVPPSSDITQSLVYTLYDPTTNTYELTCKLNSSSAVSIAILTFKPEKIDAVRVSTGTVILLTSEIPGSTTLKSLNNEPVRQHFTSGGLLALRVNPGGSGNFVNVDVLDEVTDTKYRKYGRIQNLRTSSDPAFWITSRNSDGLSPFEHQSTRFYTSEDGYLWSLGEALPLPDDVGLYGVKLYRYGDYVYAFERYNIYRSDSTLQTYHSPTALQQDLTGYIDSYRSSHQDIYQADLNLNNADGTFDDHDFITSENVIALVHNIGYQNASGDVMYQTAITEVDELEWNEDVPVHMLRMTSRDRMAWMADKYRAELPIYFDNVGHGADDFADNTNTNYGGLAHLATQAGGFTTINNELYLEKSPQSGNSVTSIAFSTFLGDKVWNGGAEIGFKMRATTPNFSDCGIIFRAADKENFWLAYYDSNADTVYLIQRRGRTDRAGFATNYTMASESSIGWQSDVDTDYKYLRVMFHYAKIYVYGSEDLINWTQFIDYTMEITERYYGEPYLKGTSYTHLERGYIGIWGETTTQRTRVNHWRVWDGVPPYSLESAIKGYAALAHVHNTSFDDLYVATGTSGWSTSGLGGTPSIAFSSDVLSLNMPSGTWAWARNDNTPIHGGYLIEADLVSATAGATGFRHWGIVFRYLADGTFYMIGFPDLTDVVAVYYYDGAALNLVYQIPFVTLANPTGRMRALFQEIQYGDSTETVWHVFSLWIGRIHLITYSVKASLLTEPSKFGIAVKNAGSGTARADFTHLHVTELHQLVDWATIDPNEAPLSAMQRIIEGYHLKYFMRYDGTLRVWKPKAVTDKHAFTDDHIEVINKRFDKRSLKNIVRQIGGYTEVTVSRPDLIRKHGAQFQEINNPYILTPRECYDEGLANIRRMEEAALEENVATPHICFLEPEDRVSTPFGDRTINAISIEYTGAENEQQLSLRNYLLGEP